MKNKLNFDVTIKPNDGYQWSDEEKKLVEERAKEIHNNRTPEMIQKLKDLAEQYKKEENE